VAPRALTQGADAQGSASARRPAHRASSSRARSAPERSRAASGGPVKAERDSRCSNSGNRNNGVELAPGVRLAWLGCDTTSFAWRPTDDTFWKLLRVAEDTGHLAGFDETTYRTLGHSRVIRTGFCSYMLQEAVLGARWGWWSNHRAGNRRLVWCEGRLAAMQEHALMAATPGAPEALAPCAEAAGALFSAIFHPCHLPVEAKVRRIDLAADLEFTDPADGLRFLQVMACLPIRGLKTDAWRCEGRVETIYQRLPTGKVRWRIYDKATELGLPTAGSRVRIERQLRYPKAAQTGPETFTAERLAALWTGELAPWTRTATDVIVAGLPDAQLAVIAAANRGEITPTQAERLLGAVAIQANGLANQFWHKAPHTARRREAELRAIGVVVDGLAWDTSVCLPLGTILRGVRDAWAASAINPRSTRAA